MQDRKNQSKGGIFIIKLLGIILVFSSIIFFSLVLANKELAVLKSMKKAESMIQTIILCLQNEHMTVPQILDYIKESSDKKTAEFIDKIDIKNFLNLL